MMCSHSAKLRLSWLSCCFKNQNWYISFPPKPIRTENALSVGLIRKVILISEVNIMYQGLFHGQYSAEVCWSKVLLSACLR